MRRVKPDPVPQEIQARISMPPSGHPAGGISRTGASCSLMTRPRRPPWLRSTGTPWASSGSRCTSPRSRRRRLTRHRRVQANPCGSSARPNGWPTTSRRCRSSSFPLPIRSERRIDLSRRLERHAGGPSRGDRELLDRPAAASSTRSRRSRSSACPAIRAGSSPACVSFGYPTGTWGVAPRQPVQEVSYRNTWGQDVGFTVPEPLWKG